MTNAPHLLPKSREGFKYGDVDAGRLDGLRRALRPGSPTRRWALLTEQCNAAGAHLTREEQDEFAARSHQRAAEAWKNGVFDDEVVPVEIPQRKGDPVVVTTDEGVRGDTTAESLAKLRPAFSKDGTITAGSASQISDGACAVVVMSKAKAEELGLDLARRDRRPRPGRRPRLDAADAAGQRDRARPARRRASRPPTSTWSRSTRRSPRSASRRPASSASTEDKVNVNGGAIALGHPVGMSGARIVLHLALELQASRRRRRRGRAVRRRRPGRRPDRARPARLSGARAGRRRLTRRSGGGRASVPTWSRGPATATPARSRG